MNRHHLTLIRPTEPVDPFARILAYGPPPGVDAKEPLKVNIGRPVLIAILEDNIAAAERNAIGASPEFQQAAAEVIARRRSVLEWAKGYPEINTWSSFAPAPLTKEE